MKNYREPNNITRTFVIDPGLAGRLHYVAASLEVTQSSLANDAIRHWLTLERRFEGRNGNCFRNTMSYDRMSIGAPPKSK
jgi:hypothetical protein